MSRNAMYAKFVLLMLVLGTRRHVPRRRAVGAELGSRHAGGGFGPRPRYPRRVTVVELGLYALLLAAAALAVWRRPVVSLYLFVVGLALHNAVMAALYAAGCAARR